MLKNFKLVDRVKKTKSEHSALKKQDSLVGYLE